mmetsp:Transcript_4585/g.6785  ORF Transcript_4585/g.6785 Transcript_4585/m.6785 type:complete len:724 (+) Transcript_4585:92-2263(+)
MSTVTKDVAENIEKDSIVKGPALVLGASGDQGRAVIQGLLASGKYSPVFGATRDVSSSGAIEAANMGAIMLKLDLDAPETIEKALLETKATYIFLVTTTDLPPHSDTTKDYFNSSPLNRGRASAKEAESKEYDSIICFFDMVVACYIKDNINRHVIFSSLDNVQGIQEDSGVAPTSPQYIQPLSDGSVVAHFSGKGRAGEYALEKMKQVPGVTLTIITLPFLYSNFRGWAIPLPNEGKIQWTLSAPFGDKAIDMFSVRDLAYVVPEIFEEESLYKNHNIRLSAERLTMHQIAATFSDVYGKDVIYSPLTMEEIYGDTTPSVAGTMAQMCQWLTNDKAVHDIGVTEAIMFPRKPQLFRDWLLSNSDDKAFDNVGLNLDQTPILNVTVFGSTSLEGFSVVKGLLKDTRNTYKITAAVSDITDDAQVLKALDPERVTVVLCDLDDVESCKTALKGAEGAFLVTEFYEHEDVDPIVEERHAKNVIDACVDSKTMRHLVFSTKENLDEMNKRMKLGLNEMVDEKGSLSVVVPHFDGKARAAAYARTKNLSCTYVLMPYYAEKIMELLAAVTEVDENTGEEQLVMFVPDQELKLMTMSVEELGPAVANIFDSYEVYAGREIGLVTDYVTISEAVEVVIDTMYREEDSAGNITMRKVNKKETKVEKWIENRGTVTKDLGQMFSYYARSDAVKKRRSVAETLQLLPDARPMRQWLEDNKNNASMRQKLGIR